MAKKVEGKKVDLGRQTPIPKNKTKSNLKPTNKSEKNGKAK